MTPSQKKDLLVQRANELYHDFVSVDYQDEHPHTMTLEKERWDAIAKKYFKFDKPVRILDVGTGTGLVPLITGKYLKKGDIFIGSDISQKFLELAERNVKRMSFPFIFETAKIYAQVPLTLPFSDNSMDVITTNSVLHHIEDLDTFCREIDRILKPKGLLFLGHDSNKRFYAHWFLPKNVKVVGYLINPKWFLICLLKKLHLNIIKKSQSKEGRRLKPHHLEAGEKISEILISEGLISSPMTFEEIEALKSIKSGKGVRFETLFPKYQMVHIETYNHLRPLSTRNKSLFIRVYSAFLKWLFPLDGATFFAVLRKN